MIDFLDAANQQIFKEQMARRRKGEQTTYEIEWTRKSGDKISTLVSPEALFDADGHLTGAFAAVTDITKRKRAEEATRQYTERLKILREIDQAILAVQSPEEIALATLQHIQRLVPCHRASVVEFDFDADEGIVLAAHAEGETRSNMRVHVPLEMFGGLEKLHDGNVRLLADILPGSFNLVIEILVGDRWIDERRLSIESFNLVIEILVGDRDKPHPGAGDTRTVSISSSRFLWVIEKERQGRYIATKRFQSRHRDSCG